MEKGALPSHSGIALGDLVQSNNLLCLRNLHVVLSMADACAEAQSHVLNEGSGERTKPRVKPNVASAEPDLDQVS